MFTNFKLYLVILKAQMQTVGDKTVACASTPRTGMSY